MVSVIRRTSVGLLSMLLVAAAGLVGLTASDASAAELPSCEDFATNPDLGLSGNPEISDLVVTHFVDDSPRCEVDFILSTRGGPEFGYEVGEQQRIGIRVGLPLNSVDGGSGGVEGAWNGRIRNSGGGGSAGSLRSVTGSTNGGYVGSSTDAGHDGTAGHLFPLALDPNRLNTGRLEDFIVNGVVAQAEWANTLAEAYYQRTPIGRYWDGCSTGGRQGLAVAQERPDLVDGWLVGAPAVNYGRFRLAQIWGQLAMKDLAGGPIGNCKLMLANEAAIEACDGDDGVVDGIITQPRTCDYDASDLVGVDTECGVITEADVASIRKIWDGPRNSWGTQIFPGWLRGTSLTIMNGSNPFVAATSQIRWNFEDADFDWRDLTMEDYDDVAELGSTTNGEIIDTRSVELEPVRDAGGKILMWHGLSDPLIQPDNSLLYYTRVASHFGGGTPDFEALQPWFRYFRAPGVSHCGGGDGPRPQDLFETMVNWVENGVAPDHLEGENSSGGEVTRTRPICMFPEVASYTGMGDVNDAANWECGGNVQTSENVCQGLVAKYQKETRRPVDVMGRYNPSVC